ncbi:MAG TPA: hypothetical protein VFR68_09670 [Candidatus Dormibacteraeota bacterium]|nr:hypothetical protein [Candidatus Dormibacteraeota bacterium]
MSLVDWSVIIMGAWVIVVVGAGLVLALRPGGGELEYDTPMAEPLRLRQTSGVMPKRNWGFRPPVRHSRYDPAPWQVQPPRSDEDSLENVDRATDIKRDLGSEHPPWERLDRQGV